jgi:Stage II sporulation protein M
MAIPSSLRKLVASISRAVNRARYPILFTAIVYFLFVFVGIIMVHTGNQFALDYRDQLVNQSLQSNPASAAYLQGHNFQAALWDFVGNLVLGAIPKTVSGFSVLLPYPMVIQQGWVGGIVSVHNDHTSRLSDPHSAIYYVLTLFLQLIPYSMAVGAGVNVGIAIFRTPPYYEGRKWLGIFPVEALRDAGRIYLIVIPLFFIASLWEFLSPWNI